MLGRCDKSTLSSNLGTLPWFPTALIRSVPCPYGTYGMDGYSNLKYAPPQLTAAENRGWLPGRVKFPASFRISGCAATAASIGP